MLVVATSCVCMLVGGQAIAAPDDPLAWIAFEEGTESYRETPYLWLGRSDIHLTIDVKPNPSHALELLWGAKNDQRQAWLTVDGENVDVAAGGYDGFRWVRVSLPKIEGERYRVHLQQGGGKAGFISAVRLVDSTREEPSIHTGRPKGTHAMSYSTSDATWPSPFPDMQRIWDGGHGNAGDEALSAEAVLFRRAEVNGRRVNEQLFRCRKFVDGWLAHADPETGLIPRNLDRDRGIWNAQDAAADNYPFMVLTAALTDRELFEGRMLEMLRTETRLTSRVDRLPDTWSFTRRTFETDAPDLARIIFGGSEYVKDGLLPLTEWLGESPWAERMIGIVDDLWKHAQVDTPFGPIPSTNVEVNGEMLQSLSRIYWMTRDDKYLEHAIRLGDYYLLGGNHPTRDFERLRLRDHGCEIIAGLAELYIAVTYALPEKKEAYRDPIHSMFDRILEVGRDEHGMLYDTIDPRSGEHSGGICDTWGYTYNGIYSVYLVDGTESYRAAVRHVLSNLKEHRITYDWGSADEYADSIEGAINLYNREAIPSAAEWIDSEIRDMWRRQRADGVIEGWHGDGNSARTAILYATWKSQGLTLRPWRPDVRFGAVRDGDTLRVSLIATSPYRGDLVFDRARHREQMRLPIDYPRINQFPEWYVADPEVSYAVRDVASDRVRILDGRKLQQGIPVELSPGVEMRLEVAPRAGKASDR